MKAPKLDGPDHDWVMQQAASLAARVYAAPDPNGFLASLPDWQRRLFHLSQAVMKIMNGGVDGYLAGSNGDEVEPLQEALAFIGASELRKTIQQAKDLFPNARIPESYHNRVRSMGEILARENVSRIDDLFEIRIDDDIWSLMRKLDPSGGMG